jgi:hypothetical protein
VRVLVFTGSLFFRDGSEDRYQHAGKSAVVTQPGRRTDPSVYTIGLEFRHMYQANNGSNVQNEIRSAWTLSLGDQRE